MNNEINKQVKELIESLNYEIDDENDISIETAKEMILQSINVAEILQKFKDNQFDEFQKQTVLNSLKDIVNIIKDI